MEKWEYLTTFMEANTKPKEVKQFVKEHFDMKRPPRYTPESMIPELNSLGDEGWELIHMEPVAGVGGKGDVRFEGSTWSNTYFCVFKRLKPGSMREVPAVAYPPQAVPASPPPPQHPIPQPPSPDPAAPGTPPTSTGEAAPLT